LGAIIFGITHAISAIFSRSEEDSPLPTVAYVVDHTPPPPSETIEYLPIIDDSDDSSEDIQEFIYEPLEIFVDYCDDVAQDYFYYEAVYEEAPCPYYDSLLHFARMSLYPSQLHQLFMLVTAEAENQSRLGQIAVTASFINRCDEENSLLYGIGFEGVFNHPNGFSPVRNGIVMHRGTPMTYCRVPDFIKESVLAALDGHDPTNGALYFYNPDEVSDFATWERSAITQYIMIGNHRFFRYWPRQTEISFEDWVLQNRPHEETLYEEPTYGELFIEFPYWLFEEHPGDEVPLEGFVCEFFPFTKCLCDD